MERNRNFHDEIWFVSRIKGINWQCLGKEWQGESPWVTRGEV